MDALTFTEARRNLKGLMDRVLSDRTPVIVMRQDAESVVIVPLADWTAMQETLHLVSSPANATRLMESLTEMDADGIPWSESPPARG